MIFSLPYFYQFCAEKQKKTLICEYADKAVFEFEKVLYI